MVCGLCHREPEDHQESSSGPTRCEYTTHRDQCPGGFRTSCDQLSEKPAEKLEQDEVKAVTPVEKDPQAVLKQLQELLAQPSAPAQQQQGVQDTPPRVGATPASSTENYSDFCLLLLTFSKPQPKFQHLHMSPRNPLLSLRVLVAWNSWPGSLWLIFSLIWKNHNMKQAT